MRVLAIVLVGTAIMAAQSAASYEVTKATGDHDFLFSFRQAAEPALTAPRDNALSEWRPLPFPWKFFGADVAGYFVSDNGYLTFDRGATASVAKPVALTDAAAPKNSIFAYWTDLKFDAGQNQWTNSVWSATLGAAPARVHVVYWMSVAPAGAAPGSAALSFLVAIHESGDFEVVYTTARKAMPLAAVVGATSVDGTRRVTAAGPEFDFPTVGFGGEDDVAFKFKRTGSLAPRPLVRF